MPVALPQVRRAVVAACVTACMTAAAAPALAQAPPQPPERRREVLGVQLSVSGASTKQGRFRPADVAADIARGSEFYADIAGALRYLPDPVGSLSYSLMLSSAVRRFQDDNEFAILGHSAGAAMAWALTEQTAVSATVSFSYLPSYSIDTTLLGDDFEALSSVAGTLPLSALDFSLGTRAAYRTNAGINLRQNLTRRLSLNVAYGLDKQDFAASEDPSYASHDMSGSFNYSLMRDLSVVLGYGRRIADVQTLTGTRRVTMDDVDAGLVFSRSLGITRSTRLSFSTGSTIRDEEGERHASLTGSATLRQGLGQRGQMALWFNRGGELTPGFGRPVFSDALNLSGSYNLTRALTFSASSGALFGRSGASSTIDKDVQSITGSAKLGYRLFRSGQLYAQLLAYRTNIDQGVELIEAVPRNSSGRTIRVGVSWAIPLVTSLPPRDGARPARSGGPPARERN
jgi:hypothetical protein